MLLPLLAGAWCLLPLQPVPSTTAPLVFSRGRASGLLFATQQDVVVDDDCTDDDEEFQFLGTLPIPLERVLVAEQGGAVDSGWCLSCDQDACALLAAAGLDGGEQLSLTLCDDEWMRDLNLKWRQVDAPTDVLSFPMEDSQLLGDLVISLDTAGRQAAERSHTLRDELRILMVHGVLHLLGYDHETGENDYTEMAAAERKLLKRLGWVGVGLIDACEASET